jgi:hypothetical protein
MPLSRNEAADALRNIAQTERRSSSAYGYKETAPFLFLWGLIWFVGYAMSDLQPAQASWLWPMLVAVGFVGSFVIGRRQPARTGGERSDGWRHLASWVVVGLFITATIVLFHPQDGRQVGAFVALIVGAAYAIAGIWMGTRLAIAGMAVMVLTIAGFVLLKEHFGLWMAFVGGGTLILTGAWLRRA